MSDDRERPKGSELEEEPIPEPAEIEAAAALGEQLDRVFAGERLPADEPLAAALMLHASQHDQSLGPERRKALLDEALAQAATPDKARTRASTRWAPALALAASLVLLLASVLVLLVPPRRIVTPPRMLPTALQSRSSDDLMGRPFQDRAGASQRLDLVFADRLAGYRQIRFGERSWR